MVMGKLDLVSVEYYSIQIYSVKVSKYFVSNDQFLLNQFVTCRVICIEITVYAHYTTEIYLYLDKIYEYHQLEYILHNLIDYSDIIAVPKDTQRELRVDSKRNSVRSTFRIMIFI